MRWGSVADEVPVATSVRTNLLYSFGYQLLAIAVPLVTAPYVTRILGPDSAGTYAYTYSIACYFALFAMLGVANHGSRSIAHARDQQTRASRFAGIYAVQLGASVIAIGSYLVYALAIATEYRTVALIQSAVVVSAALDVTWLFYGLERFKLVVVRNSVTKIVAMVCVFAFVHTSNDLPLYAAIMAVSVLVSQAILWRWVRREVGFERPAWNSVVANVKPMFVLFLPVIAYSLYRIMDKVMLGMISSMSQVAYYEYAEKILNVPNGFIVAMGIVMLPRSTNLLAQGNESDRSRYMTASLKVVTVAGGGMCFILSAMAPTLVPLYYGDAFSASAGVLEVLVFSVMFAGWASVIRTQRLIPEGRDTVYVVSMFAGAVVNLVMNTLLIPAYGAMGAVAGTMVAELLILVIQATMVRSRGGLATTLRENLPYFMIGALVWLAVRVAALVDAAAWVTVTLQFGLGCLLFGRLTAIIARRRSDEVWVMIEAEWRRFRPLLQKQR